MTTMKAAVVSDSTRPLDIREVEKPTVSEGSVVVRTEASGVYHANTGYSVKGGFAEFVRADPEFLGHLPRGLDWVPAAPIL